MANTLKKLLSLAIAVIMVLSLIPAVSAAETTEAESENTSGTTGPAADAIEIGTADEWHSWLMRTSSKLNAQYGSTGETAKFLVTADLTTTPSDLYYFGTNKGAPVNAEIDLGGKTLTITGSNTNRVFGIYDGSNLTVKNGTIVLNKPFGNVNGGLFMLHNGNLTLEDVVVNDIGEYAYGYNGKIMSIASGCSVTMTDCDITANTVASTSTYNANGALSYGIGAVIVTNGTITATNTNFTASTTTKATANTGLVTYGGMIGFQSGCVTSFTDCTFNGGYGQYGGVMCIRAGTNTITGCTFNNNKAINGGAIYVSAGTTTITNTKFNGSIATAFSGNTFGGALCVEGGTVNADGLTFENNSARYGGAVHVGTAGVLKLENSSITGATATDRAGGIHVYNADSNTKQLLVMNNTNITNCSAPYGGAIACFGRSVAKITGGTISNCRATAEKSTGGGLYIVNNGYAGGSNNVTITDTVFDGCSAAQGGNIHVENKADMRPNYLTLVNVTLKNGVATCPTGVDGYAGNLYVAGVDLVQSDTTYRCTIDMTGCTVEGGKSNYGANVGVSGHTTVNMTDCVIKNGEAAKGGGNLYLGNPNALVNIYGNTQIQNGKCAQYGGNIRIGGGQLNIYGGTIEGGEATTSGASIYLNNNENTFLKVYGGTIRTAAVEKAVFKAGALATLNLYNCNTEGFDPSEFVVYGESYAEPTGETTATVKHYAVDGATTNTATCEEEGTLTIVCPTCEHTYVYEDFGGHAYVLDKTVEPTCTESGLNEGVHCAFCDQATVEQTVIPAAGHTPAAAVKENEVAHTCTTDGSYDSVIYCETCKAELSRETGVVDPAAHTEEPVEGKDATCTEPGLTDGIVCSVCGEPIKKQEEIPMTAHDIVTLDAVAATCTAAGLTAGQYCKNCDTQTVTQKDIPMAAHDIVTLDAVAATCTETGLTAGQYCKNCDTQTVTQEEIPASHTWGAEAYNEKTKQFEKTCGVCGATEKRGVSALTITENLEENKTAEVNEDLELTVTAEGEGELTYLWLYSRPSNPDKFYYWAEPAVDNNTIDVKATVARDGYQFKCVVTDAYGNSAETQVLALDVKTEDEIVINTQPSVEAVTAGNQVAISVSATVQGEATYLWLYSRPGSNSWYYWQEPGKNASIKFTATMARDGYSFRCVITDANGVQVTTEVVTLTVNSAIEEATIERNVTDGSFTLTVDAGEGEYTYLWLYSRPSNPTKFYYWTEPGDDATITGTINGRDGYRFKCVVTDANGSQVTTAVYELRGSKLEPVAE